MELLCEMMSRSTQSPIENYAAVNSLMLDTYSEKCQDFTYKNMIKGKVVRTDLSQWWQLYFFGGVVNE